MSKNNIIVSADDSEIYETLEKHNKKKEEFIDNLFKEVQEYNKYLDSNKDRTILPFEEWRSNKYGE